ncbi:methyl-accepting chemotaxis protein [Paenibacillus albiflavus]|uniref:Methyl-accepting chemotaxis protein n=1 Tax=Paenibacillus albiflavus TaxID=2545760 RepID=A0A4R4ECS7_9BACL|nr:methyl-accepting chemotaxis protein [Paenibacillus albiflavus]TCZ77754.1 methyl-accepting chemotaxis protein [Paenibacillus albiflavus]
MRKIGIKLFLLFFCCTVSLVTAVGFLSYYESKGIIEDKLSASIKQTIEQAADKLDLIFSNYENTATQILADQNFIIQTKAYLALSDSSPDKVSLAVSTGNMLNSIAGTNSGIDGVYLIPVDGSMMVSSTYNSAVPGGNTTIVKEAWFEHVVEGEGSLVWLKPQHTSYSSTRKEPVFGLARLLRSSDNNGKNYVLIMEIRNDVLDSVLNKIKLSDTSRVVIVDDDNKLVQTSETDRMGELFDLQLSQSLFEAAREQGETTVIDREDGKQFVAYKKMRSSGWIVTAAAPLSELVKETNNILWLTVIMITIAIVVTSAAGYFVARMIGRPLTNLRNLMKKGESGDLTVRTDFRGKDEIAQLGTSFNRMMEQITRLVQQTSSTTNEVLLTAGKLLQSSKQTASSAQEIASANEHVAERAISLAMEAEKGFDLTNQIGIKMSHVQESNVQMTDVVTTIRNVSESGSVSMNELAAHTNLTETMTRSMIDRVHSLKQSTLSIQKVLDLLKSIAKQTNILSLNAAIEANRANSAGKQFLVVAHEIRTLAEQSKRSIEQVEAITDLIQLEIDETVAVMSEAYPVFNKQIESAKEAEVVFEQVQLYMGAMAESLQGVTESIYSLDTSQSELSGVIGHVSALSQESSAASEQVSSQSIEQLSISEGLLTLSNKLEQLSNSLKESLKNFDI